MDDSLATLVNLEKLNTLIEWVQDASIGPEQRFQLLQEIAEEAARYKLGGDDKIRVAGGACDGVSGLHASLSFIDWKSRPIDHGAPATHWQPPQSIDTPLSLAPLTLHPFHHARQPAASVQYSTRAGTPRARRVSLSLRPVRAGTRSERRRRRRRRVGCSSWARAGRTTRCRVWSGRRGRRRRRSC